jgi:hypothetical protein
VGGGESSRVKPELIDKNMRRTFLAKSMMPASTGWMAAAVDTTARALEPGAAAAICSGFALVGSWQMVWCLKVGNRVELTALKTTASGRRLETINHGGGGKHAKKW